MHGAAISFSCRAKNDQFVVLMNHLAQLSLPDEYDQVLGVVETELRRLGYQTQRDWENPTVEARLRKIHLYARQGSFQVAIQLDRGDVSTNSLKRLSVMTNAFRVVVLHQGTMASVPRGVDGVVAPLIDGAASVRQMVLLESVA